MLPQTELSQFWPVLHMVMCCNVPIKLKPPWSPIKNSQWNRWMCIPIIELWRTTLRPTEELSNAGNSNYIKQMGYLIAVA